MQERKRIDLIIPFYNQKNYLIRALSSVMAQSIAQEIDITIIDDASTEEIDKELDFFKPFLSIQKIHLNRNRGPGYARQLGLDITQNPFVTFMDADDVYENTYALEYMRGLMLYKETPAVFTSFVEECSDGRKIPHVKDNTWIFGKMYRRAFLDENKITFNDSRENEDKGFNCAVMLCAQKDKDNPIRFEDRITYSWKWNNSSITRKDNFDYRHRDLIGFTYNTVYAIDIAIRADAPKEAIARQATVTMIYLYFRYLENLKTQDYTEENIISLCFDFYEQEYRDRGYAAVSPMFKPIYDSQVESFNKRGLLDASNPEFPFENFILKLQNY